MSVMEKNMNKNETLKKLEEMEERYKNEIPPCDLENDNYTVIKLRNKDATTLKELLNKVISQIKD